MSTEPPFISKDFATLSQAMLAELGNSGLNDITEGSVVRTLTEVFARELAVCYQQLQKVYRFGYLDTAEGVALDNVIALLGLKRYGDGHLEGSVDFSRRQPAPEDINIPAGTLVSGRDLPLFKTIKGATLQQGDTSVNVQVASLEAGSTVEAAQLSVMPRPIWGIETVNNPSPLRLRQRAESDEEFRERARNAIRLANRGTVSSLSIAIRSLGIDEVSVLDQIEARPGEIDIILGDADINDDLLARVKQAIEAVRPAGVKIEVHTAQRIWVRLYAVLELDKNYPEQRREEIANEIKQALHSYVDGLGNGDRLRWTKINSILTNHDAVMAMHKMKDHPDIKNNPVFLKILDAEDTVEGDSLANRQISNKDILPLATERIGFDPKSEAINLLLEPPYLDVWLDVYTKSDPSFSAEEITGLNKHLRDLTPGDLDFDDLVAILSVATSFRLTHERNAQVVELKKKGQKDRLVKREIIKLRQVTLPEVNHD